MKKLVGFALILVVGMSAHAASFNWSVDLGSRDYNSSGSTPGTMYAYLIDTTDTTSYDTLVAYFTSDKTTSWTTVTSENLYVASGNPRGQGTWSSSTSDISDDTTTAIVFALVVGDVAEGSPYYITSAISLSGLTYSDTDMGDEYDYDFFDLVSNGGKSGVFAVPEPTSGLLFLMGIAGLGLKRKRV